MFFTRLIYLQTCDILREQLAPYAAQIKGYHTPLRGEQQATI